MEDYLKAIYTIAKKKKGGWVSNSEIANMMNVQPSSVTEMLYSLKNEGLIIWNPRKSARLTDKGKKKARQLTKNFENFYKFFTEQLKIKDKELVEKICCKIEHEITPNINQALRDFTKSH